MMKKINWKVLLVVGLVFTSIIVYFIQIRIFGTVSDTFFYFFQDLAFLPLEVLIVTLIINELLKKREKRSVLTKMNMAVGSYFNEVGNELLKYFSLYDLDVEKIKDLFSEATNWNDKFFLKLKKTIKDIDYTIDIKKGDLEELKKYLISKRNFMILLLGNSNLLEHESFTDLLWAVSHLTEELWFREDLTDLAKNDADHLANDMKRAYKRSLIEWVSYMKHLRNEYPYIFSLYSRANPFDRHAKIEFV